MEGYLSKLRGLASSAVNAIQSKIGRDYAVDLSARPVGHSGLWALHRATRRSSSSSGGTSGGTQVTVWVFEKQRYFEQGINRQLFTEREQSLVVERLRAEAGQLTRLRHPSVLQVVEPLEETRTWLMFVTEQVIASLDDLIQKTDSVKRVIDGDEEFELDDLEIQKGLLQVSKALGFLHSDAHIVHGNLVPASVLVNSKGDWKLGGFGFTQPANAENPRRFEHDYQMPEHTQQDLDYLAPEYVLHGTWSPACDVFAFGCLVAAVYEGAAPMRCRNDVGAYRREIARLPDSAVNVPEDLMPAVTGLLRSDPHARATLRDFQDSKYFNDVRVATLRYLETLVEQAEDQKIQFLRSLVRILPKFPDRILRCKIQPLLYEHATDTQLLPFIMPSVMFIIDRMTADEFARRAMAGLKPLLAAVHASAPSLCVVLDHLAVLEAKAPAAVFRADIMDLVYGALMSTDASVQDKALHAVPSISKKLDPHDLQEKLLPRVQHVYARASVLTHKVRALICLHGMLPSLDKETIISKVMPMLKRTKTREPAVVMAMLAMYEELGLRHLDKQAVAAEVLPVLWAQCVDGRLRAEQFARFMQVIRKLGDRVEKEHLEYLDRRKRVLGDGGGATAAAAAVVDDSVGGDDFADDMDTGAFEAMVLGGSQTNGNSRNSSRRPGQQPAMQNPLADLGNDAKWAWDADEPLSTQSPLAPSNGSPSVPRSSASTVTVDVDFIASPADDEFGAFGSYVSPTTASANANATQKNVASRLRTTTPQRLGNLPNYNISPKPMTLIGQTASAASKFSTSQKHAGGKASDLGDFDPFA
ncbi:Protein kinase domain-containing protein ppk32 [Coemansia sp. IMI 209127]|nr:Protein kinase domain-containing protein ppk32 [Coemansia sp. IMI 209127]